MSSKAQPKAARRPSRAVGEKPAATKPKGTAGRGERSTAAKRKASSVGAMSSAPKRGKAASRLIDGRIRELGDWRGKTLEKVRRLIKQADPDVVEEWKWRGTPVWSHGGDICTGETYQNVVKLTFSKGASLKDPSRLFNSSLDGRVRRAIDIHEGDEIDEAALKDLVRAAVASNLERGRSTATKTKAPSVGAKPKLLSGGNPQIPKGDGDAPVQAYIAAMPGWKRDVGRRLDALIERTVPNVRKAVRWNSPFYAVEGQGWFLAFHCFTKYVKVTFFRGTSLRPLPPVGSKDPNTRSFHVQEDDRLDQELVASWIRQASELPGWVP